ncbi:hypothetical protein RI103_25680 [Paraburkholderia sp. FT54]|uniref:hypothetical protein n=1 Tax=Paraburkholderia sp. FT54 TaxID=3074437 RepID=UPI0028779EB1|nr:hypothetical protein [Paraburkholderia sp. FT54]WNC94156.1 hypothetical protein RI103_25680 [Paraburkholderia sp. FT54]
MSKVKRSSARRHHVEPDVQQRREAVLACHRHDVVPTMQLRDFAGDEIGKRDLDVAGSAYHRSLRNEPPSAATASDHGCIVFRGV